MRSIVCGALLALATSVAVADNKTDAANTHAEGQKKFVAKDYAGAVELFLEAYKLDPDPAYLFNIAQAYRLDNQCASASTYYQKFLDAVPAAPNAEAVRGHISEMDACAKEQSAPKPPPPPPPQPDPPPPPPPVTTTSSGGGRGLAYASFAVAAGGIVAGIVFNRRVAHWQDQRERLCPPDTSMTNPCEWTAERDQLAKDYEKHGKRNALLQVVSFSVGGAALVAGIVLLSTGKQAKSEHAMRVVPTSNGALVRWSF